MVNDFVDAINVNGEIVNTEKFLNYDMFHPFMMREPLPLPVWAGGTPSSKGQMMNDNDVSKNRTR